MDKQLSKIVLLFIVGFIAWCGPTFSQTRLQGSVFDRSTGLPLRNVSVLVENSALGDVTDKHGHFSILGLEEGVYTVRLSLSGFKTVHREIVIKESRPLLSIGISMRPSVARLHQEVLITAQRYERDPFLTPASVSSVDLQDVKQKTPRTLPEALQGEPGIWLHQPYYGGTEARIRGMGGNRTMVMVDGIRMNHAAYGPASHSLLSVIDPYSMNRIEVLRGGGSVQYGTDALGGVIQVLTRTPRFSDEGIQVHGGGNFRYMNRGMELSGRSELEVSTQRVAVSGGISQRNYGDLVLAQNQGSLGQTGYQEQAADVKARIKLAPHHSLTLSYQIMTQDSLPSWGLVSRGKFVKAGITSLQRQLAYARMTSFFGNKWLHKVSVTTAFHTIDEGNVRQMEALSDVRTETDEFSTWSGTVEVHSRPLAQWNIVSGVEYYRDEINSQANLIKAGGGSQAVRGQYADGSLATNVSIYSLHTLDILKLRVTMGGRARAYQLAMNDALAGDQNFQPRAVVGNISGLYPLHPNWHLVSSLNTGVRNPNVQDLSRIGLMDQGIGLPSDSLTSERSLTSEIGLKAKTDHFSGSLMFYHTRFRDRTDWVPGTFNGQTVYEGLPIFQQVHVGQASIRGIEAAIEVPVNPMLAVYGGLVYTQGRNLVNNEPLEQIPPLNGRLGLRMRTKYGVWSNLEWRHASLQDRLAPLDLAHPYIGNNGTAGWNVVDLHIGYDFPWGYATIGVKNLLDESYRVHGSTLNAPGRLVLMSLQLGF